MVERLVEREAVLAELDRCRRAAARGAGRVVLLRGQAGVGKTMVIGRFVGRLGSRARVLRGWCDGLATPRGLGPLIDMLAGLAGEPAARVRAGIAAGDPEAFYARLLGLLGTGDGKPWVWVIEDAHWGDGATLDLLRFLARRIEALPVLLVVSYRDDEIGEQHPLAVLLGDVATHLDVHPDTRTEAGKRAHPTGIRPRLGRLGHKICRPAGQGRTRRRIPACR